MLSYSYGDYCMIVIILSIANIHTGIILFASSNFRHLSGIVLNAGSNFTYFSGISINAGSNFGHLSGISTDAGSSLLS